MTAQSDIIRKTCAGLGVIMAVAFFAALVQAVGVILGAALAVVVAVMMTEQLLENIVGERDESEDEEPSFTNYAPTLASKPVGPEEVVAEMASPEPAEQEAGKPAALTAPRNGAPDALTDLKGLGPKAEEALNAIGVFHFDQIAVWSEANLLWIDENVDGLKGRARRYEWVAQARSLAGDKAGE